MQVSLVVPLLNEAESLPELAEWISRVMEQHHYYDWEVIFVDDGSTDNSWQVITDLHLKDKRFKGQKFRRNYGKSAALNTGFLAAMGKVVITMDADLQDSPDEIPELYNMINRDGYAMVSGWKKERHDPITKTLPSKFFNRVTSLMTGIKLHDFNCGLKAYRNDVIKHIEVYGEMHRYIPMIVKSAGYTKIGEKVVQHQARKYGTTKFGWERFVRGFLDLISIMFVAKFGKRPMHIFGTLGSLSFIAGGLITIWLIVEKMYKINHQLPFRQITDQPLFYIALVAVVVGAQLFVAGFLGELISRNSPFRNVYEVEESIQ